ncbi:unnamed protein product [Cuscuta campestris]|uniref:Uncharacterized protein n=1 Tax=Cuscuta campestris TaxID=132261 RepID=A0A484M2H5_9ASTE|nr:unnamed protein product [Cuscuta campestris]
MGIQPRHTEFEAYLRPTHRCKPFAVPHAALLTLTATQSRAQFEAEICGGCPQRTRLSRALARSWPCVNRMGDAFPPGHVSICPSRRWNDAPANSIDGVPLPDADSTAITFPATAHKKKKEKALKLATPRDSAFERLGEREDGQRKSAKPRLGKSVAHVSAFARLGKGKEAEPARTQRSRLNRQAPAKSRVSRQQEEAKSKPREPVRNRLTIPGDRVQQMEAKLERLEKKVGEKKERERPIVSSPFTARVHLTPFPRKVKVDAPRFTGKEDLEIHLAPSIKVQP